MIRRFASSTLRARLLCSLVAGLVTLTAALLLLLHYDLGAIFAREAESRLKQVVQIGQALLPDGAVFEAEPGGLRAGPIHLPGDTAFLDRLGNLTGATIEIIQDGRVLASSPRNPDGSPLLRGRVPDPRPPELVEIDEELAGDFYYSYYEPIRDAGGRVIGQFGVHGPRSNFEAWVAAILTRIVMFALPLGLGLAGLFAWLLAHQFRGFEAVRRAMGAIADGALHHVVPHTGSRNEIGAMAGAVEIFRRNGLQMRALEIARAQATAESAELARFVRDSPSAFLRLDRAGGVRFSNPAGEALLAEWRAARPAGDPGLGAALQPALAAVLDGQRASETDWEIGAEIYALLLSPGPDGTLVNLYARSITAERLQRRELAHLADHDPLTGLANRRQFMQAIERMVALPGAGGRVMFLDLDQFKEVNDTLGHGVGDRVLVEVAERLGRHLGEGMLLARLGGDEFAILAPGLDADGADRLAGALVAAIAPIFQIDLNRIRLGVSIGIAAYPGDGQDRLQMVRKADLAMYRAKADGRNTFRHYEPAFETELDYRRRLLIELDGAIERGEIAVHYQPKVDILSGRIIGAEALLRWTHPEQGPISPALFIPIAEQSGLIAPLGRHVLRTACRDAAGWPDTDGTAPHVAVNLSAVQLKDRRIVELVAETLAESGLPAGRLELEITESAVMTDVETVIETLTRLRALGVQLAIDDFGTGYSSLSYLRRFPLTKMKIDRSFVVDMTDNADARAIAGSILALGVNLGLSIVAEGIETVAQRDLLCSMGCHEGQGFLFSRAVPDDRFRALLAAPAGQPQ